MHCERRALPTLVLLLLPVFSTQQQAKSIPQPSVSSTPASDFTCPEDFGYFPHPSDCSQYYVCVFGGALLESCTGGLMYSHDLQTCDWPRNVYCYNGTGVFDNNLETAQQQASRVRATAPSRGASSSSSPSSYAYSPIKIETYGQLSRAAEESSAQILGKKPQRVIVDDEYQQQRSGRSYEGSLPNYKEEIYNTNLGRRLRVRRHVQRYDQRRRTKTTTTTLRPSRGSPRPSHRHTSHRLHRRVDYPLSLKYKLPVSAGLKTKPMLSAAMSHRVSSPGNILYPPSYYQTPTYGFVNIDKVVLGNGGGGLMSLSGPNRLRPSVGGMRHTTLPPSRVVKITSRPDYDSRGDGSYSTSHRFKNYNVPMVLGEYLDGGNPYAGVVVHQGHLVKGASMGGGMSGGMGGGAHKFSMEGGFAPDPRWKVVEPYYNEDGSLWHRGKGGIKSGSLSHHVGSVSSSPLVNTNTRSKYGSTSKYYDNTAPVQQQPQTEDYGTDDVYVNQRYAANVANTSSANQYYAPVAASAAEDEDASYYVYDDEEEEVPAQGGVGAPVPNQGKYDFDYKYTNNQGTTYTRPSVTPSPAITRRPLAPAQPIAPAAPPRTTSTSTRTRTRTNTPTTSTSTRTRPTLKPKSSIVKQSSAPVRDVYLDAPSRPENIYESPAPNTPATKCRKDLCVLPDCYCGGKEIPGGLRASETPQIVLLTFDDSVNDLNKNLYRDLFEKGRKNPNGCPISATFYISHEWTDYSQVQNLAADGHEIASHSVSHSFGEQYSQKKWDREINGQREILAAYGGVKLSEVRGMRAPFLAIGGNNMFKMLHDANFTYDSSMPIYENRPPSWPYTLDYRIFHDCMIPPCPTKSYPGVWEVPMVMWQDLKGGRCSMGDACSNPPTAEGVYQMLAKNFERHYTMNRAPFGLYYHAAWFTQPHHKEGFEAFLDTLVQMDDVWLVTNWQALQWIRSPVPSNRALNFEPWSCHNAKDRPPRCNHPKVCNLWHKSGVRYMKTCQQCPQQYPWTGNTGVPFSNSV